MPVSAWCYIPTSLPQEQAAKTSMVSGVRIQVYIIMRSVLILAYDWPCPHEAGNALNLMDRRRWHIPNKPPFTRLATLLVSNAWIEHKRVQYWWWFMRQWCRDVASGADRGILTQKFISDCRYRVIESSSLVPVLFREVFSHSYISFFHLLVNGFSVTCKHKGSAEYWTRTLMVPGWMNYRLKPRSQLNNLVKGSWTIN